MPRSRSASPLRAIIDIRRGELPLALLMCGYFFLVISTFWILKPIKKSLFIGHYDAAGLALGSWVLRAAQAELIAKILNMVVAAVAVILFTWLSRRYRRQELTLIFAALFAVGFVLYALVLERPSDLAVWSFYLYGDLYSTLMVATFFAFLNDSVAPEAARRLYGVIVLGGVAGGVFGTGALRLWIDALSTPAWLAVCLGITAVVAALAVAAGRRVDAREAHGGPPPAPTGGPERAADQERRGSMGAGNPALEGARLVFRSPYLTSIVAMVTIYEIVSTLLDYQFSETVGHYLDGDAIKTHLATVFLITSVASLVVQIFFTSLLMSRFRLTVPLLVLPVAVALASGMFLMVPALWFGSMLSTSDNALSYSLNQSTREALYTPTSRNEKYKAKAFIDMFAQRFAKALAVVLSLGVTALFTSFAAVRWLSVATLALVALWAWAALRAGRGFHELSDGPRGSER